MHQLDNILLADENVLLSTLDSYQFDIVSTFLIQTEGDYLASADKWLMANQNGILGFGKEQTKTHIYRDKIIEEVEKLLCGDESYTEERNKIFSNTDTTEKYLISALSAAIGDHLGTAGVFIFPAVVMILLSFAKMPVKAWCAMRQENKNNLTKES